MASADPEPSIDPPDEDFDQEKPYWVGYFRLPHKDVECKELFEPNYNLVPNPPKADKKPASKVKFGKWKDKTADGQIVEKPILVKSIDVLHEREARILSSVSGSDPLAQTYNIVRFYGATINEGTKEYNLVLEHCDMYLQDYVLDKESHVPDPQQWHTVATSLCKQIANGMRYLHWKAPYNPIIHRDLHPLSVLVIKGPNEDVTAKLFGFQHAKILGEHETMGQKTVAPDVVELWQAPEYVRQRSDNKNSPLVDVYSYAMLVWHIFTRQLPYGGRKMALNEVKQLIDEGKRPDIPAEVPEFWCELIKRAWQDKQKDRPDFIKIYKAIENVDASMLDPHYPLREEEKITRPKWQLDPAIVPQAHDRIISNKTNQYSVVHESEDGTVVLKKPIKGNREIPSPEEFKRFMEFSAGLNHPNILRFDGVFFLESLQMPLMKCSVRQYREGKTVMREVKCDKEGCEQSSTKVPKIKGWGNMQPKCVKQVAEGVARGLFYLHSQKGVSHDGLSSSNVLLKYREDKCSDVVEVKLVDYQLGLLGTSSQSHASRNCMYEAPEGTDPKRADLYSLGVLMVYMYRGEPRKKKDPEKRAEWEEKSKYEDNPDHPLPVVAKMWADVVSKCLDIDQFPSLSAEEVVSALEAIDTREYS